MGSGHILVYAFDVLFEIYTECGYTKQDAACEIIRNNLYGFDIDKRCSQLAYFSLMMKARSCDRRFFTRNIQPQTYYPINDKDLLAYGSLVTVNSLEAEPLRPNDITLYDLKWEEELNDWNCRRVLSQKYTVCCANPPYLNKYNALLKAFVTKYYKDYSGDLFSVFMFRNFGLCKQDGYSAFMTPLVWMFIKTYEKLRQFIIKNKKITTLIQMEYSAFEEATVPICSFVLKNGKGEENSLCFRLSDFKGGMDVQKVKVLEAIDNPYCGYFYEAQQSNFSKIPGSPVAYWVSEKFIKAFDNKSISNYMNCKSGIMTGSDKYICFWFEPSITEIKFDCKTAIDMHNFKWFPLNSGGDFRKWYGNNQKIVNLWNNGAEIKANVKNYRLRDKNYYFKKGITWGRITSSQIAFRNVIDGSLFGDAGPIGFIDDNRNYVLGFLCSKVVHELLQITNPTLNFQVSDIMNLPLKIDNSCCAQVEALVQSNISLSRADWDSFETSWDFTRHPLARSVSTIAEAYDQWESECTNRFNTLKSNEEELNRIFIDIYGLQDELTPDVEDKDVTVRLADKTRDVKSLLSYAVGCMFGRYSLDCPGLVYAGGEWNEAQSASQLGMRNEEIGMSERALPFNPNSKKRTFLPCRDNVISITDTEYLEDDIISRLSEWLKAVYGESTLEQNLDFIADALSSPGNTSRDIIRNYFLREFYSDHVRTYQKRPIYWLFDSGKQNGFKALIYLHRYNADTIGDLRIDYLHRMQRVYESEISRMQDTVDHSGNAREVSRATKQKEKLQKQLKECREYDERLSHLALSRIDLDLDDGVKVNYEKVQTARDGIKYHVLAKI